ncbi:hypothetical protein TEA_010057 [Camellia sinensis var. sinensis]|uniref:Disease resistance protein At4g27190-like leucine-rich repeats domain-containing protein n=1 Tax=Camellia sinensis var. sinensis TaxID=542762 RepID=A0A4S4DSU2_CAMSN|nr:hypothetical protein TEA_010057 [Camellia sinensis var. sinensis]
MYVNSCAKLKYVFQPSIAQALHQLEELFVSDCEEMEEIVAKKNEGQEERVDKMMFKSLKKIKLEHLPMLSGFYTGDFPFECPSLEELIVRDCPKMKTSAATAPKLKVAILDNLEKTLQGMDLNQVVQNHSKQRYFSFKR